MTTEDFIKKSKEKWGDRFDYSSSFYINAKTKIKIICKKSSHGAFYQLPNNHYNNQGCPQCTKELMSKARSTVDTKEFIRRSKEKFGDKFSYAKTNYIENRKEVIITCNKREHGDFKTLPYVHLRGDGSCPLCRSVTMNKIKKLPINEVNKRLKKKFNDKITVVKEEYYESIGYTLFNCKLHGNFKSSVNPLRDCPKCIKLAPKIKSKYSILKDSKDLAKKYEMFIEDAKCRFGNRFIYNFEEFKGMTKNTNIKCSIHPNHTITQTPKYHLGAEEPCIECRRDKRTKEFIKLSKERYPGLFTYEKTKFITTKTPLTITCIKHGDLNIDLYSHTLHIHGCKPCEEEERYNKYLEKFKEIHNDKFIYYKNTEYGLSIVTDKMKIKCKDCGNIFFQGIHSHAQGFGCPVCKTSFLEKYILKYLQDNNIKYESQYSFKDCKNIRLLLFDFVIFNKDNSIKCLLEGQGIQHFQAIPNWFGGEEAFKLRRKRDQIKRDYCKKNSIPLIEVKYDVKDIPKYLDKALKALDKS